MSSQDLNHWLCFGKLNWVTCSSVFAVGLCASLKFVPQTGSSELAGGGHWVRPFNLFNF